MDPGVPDVALIRDAVPRRIAVVASYGPSLALFRGPLIREMIASGHAVMCAAPDLEPALAKELEDWGAETFAVPLSRTGLNPLADLRSLRALVQLFRGWAPDVVMGYTPKPAIYASIAARRAGVENIVPMVTGLGYAYLEGGGLKRATLRAVLNGLYKRAFAASTGVIFHNEDDAQVFRSLGLLPADLPVTVVRGSGVDLGAYQRQPLPPIEEQITFLMVARLVRYKGVQEYCVAARMLRERGLKARCILVGPAETGPAGFPVERLEKFSDVMTYAGPSDDVPGWLARCHVYVLPSYGEGMPRTVLEALAAARPIITCDTRGCRQTVREGQNGYLVPVADPEALANAMGQFIEHPESIAPMGAASRALAEDEFDVARVNASMLKALGLTRSD